jgi:hypothetical protein
VPTPSVEQQKPPRSVKMARIVIKMGKKPGLQARGGVEWYGVMVCGMAVLTDLLHGPAPERRRTS